MLMAFVILWPKFPLVNIPGTYVAVRVEDVLIALASLVWLIVKLPNSLSIFKEKIYLSIGMFWLAGALSLLSAILITYSVTLHLGLLHWLRRVEYMMMFIMAATTLTSLQQVRNMLKIGWLVVVLVVIYGFGQLWLGFPVISTTNREFSKGLILHLTPDARVNSTFAGHYDLAAFLSVVLIMMASNFFLAKSFFKKITLAVGGGLSLLLLSLTAARVSFVAGVAGIIVSLWLVGQRLLIGAVLVVVLIMLVAIPELRHRLVATLTVNLLGGGGPKYELSQDSGVVRKTFLSEASREALLREATKAGAKIATVAADISPGEPINTTELGVYRSWGIRLNVEWPRAIRAFFKNPLLGTGYSSLTIATDNDLLRSLGEVGLLGTAALILILVMILRKMADFIMASQGFEKSFVVGVFSVTVAVLLTGLFIDVLEASKIALLLWFLLGVSWAMMKGVADD